MIWRAVLLAGLVAGCSPSEVLPNPAEREARSALDLQLNDAQSARFRDVRLVVSPLDGKTRLICGLVNAKNVAGAYVGWRRFVAQRNEQSGYISPDATEQSAQSEQAMQPAFESIYPADLCPASGYEPSGMIADMIGEMRRNAVGNILR